MTSLQLPQAIDVRVADAGDADALLDLHRRGFASEWQPRHWRWRYVDNPLRRTTIVGAFAAPGNCLASFCGVPLPCRFGDRTELVNLGGDVVLHPKLRQTVAGGRLLLRVATHFLASFCGGPTRMIFGFPQPGLCRVLTEHCGFQVLHDVVVLVRTAAADRAAPGEPAARELDGLPPDLDDLSARWQQQGHSGVVRDARYLRWRYVDNPHAAYRFFAVRSGSGGLRGFSVLRPDAREADVMLIVDWLVPNDDPEATRMLLATTQRAAQNAGRRNLAVSFAAAAPESAVFQREHGFRSVLSGHRFAFRTYDPAVDAAFLLRDLHHSLGDLDCT